jgi:hypothetical protein
MRKFLAIIFTICLVFPMLLASQVALSTATWALDRRFYIETLENERLYQAMISDEVLGAELRSRFSLPADTDTQALLSFFGSIISQDYFQEQVTNNINGLFDSLQGKTDPFEPAINLAPIKSSLTAEKQEEFLTVLVSILPVCQAGQTPGFGEGQVACKPSGIPDEFLMDNFLKPALPLLVAQLPDEIPLMGEEWQNLQTEQHWYTFIPGMAIPASLVLVILFLAFMAACLWYITALIADDTWRVRLQWLGWSLIIPSALTFILGVVLQGSTALYWIDYGLQHASLNGVPGIFNSTILLQILAESALPRVASSFLTWGGICASLALGMIVWGLATPRRKPE